MLPAFADQLIIEPDMGREPILNAINSAQHSIDLVMYGFTDERIRDALLQQHARGRTVKVILEDKPYKADDENLKTIAAFDKNHVNWQGNIPPYRLIHQKTLLIDDKKAIVMTFNFTHSTFKKERNFALVIDSPAEVREIENVFAADWNHKPFTEHADNLIWSPDDSRQKLLALIGNARRDIKIYSQNINDYKLVGALAKAAHKGVKVNILTSAKIGNKQANYLARAGVIIHRSEKLYIHAKVFIIDEKKAVVGSINLTSASLDTNRELSVLTEDSSIIKQLSATFEKDWQSADTAGTQTWHFNQHDITHAMNVLKHYAITLDKPKHKHRKSTHRTAHKSKHTYRNILAKYNGPLTQH